MNTHAANSALVERLNEPSDTGATRCSRCGGPMHCAALAGESRCWCMELPPLAVADATQGCLCRACLTAATTG